MKRNELIFVFFICLVVLVSCQNTEDFGYNERDGAITITEYYGSSKDVKIPKKIKGKLVRSIGNDVFKSKQLISVTLPDSVTSIGGSAFEYNQLTSITIPKSVTSIGGYGFDGNPLTSVSIGENVLLSIRAISWYGFNVAYDKYGKQAGTYTRPNTESSEWTKK